LEGVLKMNENWKPSWWQRILFKFKRTHIAYDSGNESDHSVTILFKRLGDRILIIGEKIEK